MNGFYNEVFSSCIVANELKFTMKWIVIKWHDYPFRRHFVWTFHSAAAPAQALTPSRGPSLRGPTRGRTPTPSVTTCGPGSSVSSTAELFKNGPSHADHLRTPALAACHASPHKHPPDKPELPPRSAEYLEIGECASDGGSQSIQVTIDIQTS